MNSTKKSRNRHGTEPVWSPSHWLLQDTKARFIDLVQRVRSEGHQDFTVHGREAVLVNSAEELRRLGGDSTGKALIAAMKAPPYRDINVEPGRTAMPVRNVTL